MLFCYHNEKRIHISEYNELMNGNIYCAEGHPVIAKRGTHKCHHFAHKSNTICECSDNKGEWHIWWQNRVKNDNQEVRLLVDKKYHIADIYISKSELNNNPIYNNGIIIEIQHSPMTEETMKIRENFYTNNGYHLIWIFDCTNWEYHTIRKYKDKNNNKMMSIRYKKGAKFPLGAQYTGNITKIFDFGKKDLFVITEQHGPSSVTGYLITLDDFDKKYIQNAISPNVDIRIFHHNL